MNEQELMTTRVSIPAISVRFLATFFCLFASAAMAQSGWQTHQELQTAAERHIRDQFSEQYDVYIRFRSLDSRLRLARCQRPLKAYLTSRRPPAGAVNVGIRCTSPQWKVRIPATVQAFTEVQITRRPVARGSVIQEQDLTSERRDIGRYYAGVFEHSSDLVGMVARRGLRAAMVLTPRMVKPRRLVTRGQQITILAESNGLLIRARGEALMDGHVGQVISVKNSRSGRKISAEVVSQSTVRVKM